MKSDDTGWLSAASPPAARHHRVPAHGRAAVRRTRQVAVARSRRRWPATSSCCSQRSVARRPTIPSEEDIFAIGTVGHIIQLLRFPKGPVKVLVEGRARARIRGFAAERAVLRLRRRGRRGARRGRVEIAGAHALGAGRVRGLRQAQHAHPARDARQRPDDRRAGPARRHDRRARRAQAEGQAGAARDAVAGASASSGSAS